MSSKLADRLEIWGFEDDVTVFCDGSYGYGMELNPIDVSCWDDDRINALADSSSQFLNGLPSGISIQFVQDIKSGNGKLLDEHKGEQRRNHIGSELAFERANRLHEKDKHGGLPAHRLYFFLRRYPQHALVEKPKLLSKTKLFESIAEEKLRIEISTTKQLMQGVIQGFNSLGISSKVLTIPEILDLTYEQWNPDRGVSRGAFDPNYVRDSLVLTDGVIHPTGFQLGDFHHRIVSLKMLPEVTYAAMAQRLRDLPFDSRLFLSISIPDQQKELESLQTQRRVAFSMARSKRSGVSDIESETKLQDLESLLEDMVAQGEKVFHVSFNVLLRSKDPEDLEYQVTQTLIAIRELSGAEGMVESLAGFDIFCEMAIPNARSKERSRRLKTTNLVDFLPIYGPWSGHDRPSVLLRTRLGSLLKYDPFSIDLTNYNHVVSGGSGSGKSYLTNLLLLQAMKEDPKIFIVDIGGSYRKLCENLSGQYIELGVGNGLSLNPFDLMPGTTTPPPEKIKFLLGLLELMTKESDQESVDRLTRAEFEEAIQKCYEGDSLPRLSVLREHLLKHDDVSIRKFGRILSMWCGETPFGQFIDQKTNIELHKSIVCFDLKNLEHYPDLQSVCLFLITDLVWREVQKDRFTKKFLVFDECWKLLENDSGAIFIADVFRTFRKYFAGAVAISQNIDDFAKSKVATAILSNSSTKWILMQKGSDQRRLKEVLQLNDNEMAQIASLKQERGVYSEAFLMAQDQRTVAVIESTPLEYWIATTDPRDLSFIEKQKQNFDGTQFELLRKLATDYPKGVAGGITHEK